MQYTTEIIWQKFRKFFESRDHLCLPPSSIVPENDPSVLFTTAGMQQFKQYYLNPKLAPAPRVISCQPCFRTTDIEEVGDDTHLTIFEMLGNFSFGYHKTQGSYFKREAVRFAWQFLTKELRIASTKLSASYFAGEDEIPKDTEALEILLTETNLSKTKIFPKGREDNFWGPTGESGPCGRTIEFQYDGVEIWNLVFNEFFFENNKFTPTERVGVDTGAGLERITTLLNGFRSVYEIELLSPLLKKINIYAKSSRIIADHLRAIAYLISDDVLPSNKEQGYILRRLIRRVLKAGLDLNLKEDLYKELFGMVCELWERRYPFLKKNVSKIVSVFNEEKKKYKSALEEGIKEFNKLFREDPDRNWGESAFYLYTSFGLPPEMTFDDLRRRLTNFDSATAQSEYLKAEERHKELSRAGLQRFKGGLAGHSEAEIRLHTATHLLLASLRKVLGSHVIQRGANITPERLRLDFSHSQKLSEEEIKKIEALVNEWIERRLQVKKEEMGKEEALRQGAVGAFLERYGERVFVYTITDGKEVVSKEICGGPHVQNTGMLANFKILKEESSSGGVRRIKAVVSSGPLLLKSI